MTTEIPLAQYLKMKYPLGGPCMATLRSHIDRGVLHGRAVEVGKQKRYFVILEPAHSDPEIAEILRETMRGRG